MLSHQVIDGQCEFFWFGVGYSSFPAHPLDTDTFELVSHINKAEVLCLVCSQENVSWDPQDGSPASGDHSYLFLSANPRELMLPIELFHWVPYLGQRMQLSLKRKMSPFLRGTLCFAVLSPFFLALGISATSEDIPNKIEDLRSECSSDFGGKDSVTSPDGEESVHGRKIPASPSEPSAQCHFIGKHCHLLSHWTALVSAFSHTVKWLWPIRISLVMILSVLYLKCKCVNQEISV